MNRIQNPNFDRPTLNYFRNLIHPLYSPIPEPEIPRLQLREELKIEIPDSVILGRSIFGMDSAKRSLEPYTMIEYAHGRCVLGGSPDVVMVSKEAVQKMDENASKRLKNISALLDAGVCVGDRDTDYAELLAVAEDDVDGSIFASFPEDGRSQSPSSANLSSSSQAVSPTVLKPGLDAWWSTNTTEARVRSLLTSEKKRLKECLATSSLAKAMYFKRCNGEYINALDDVLCLDIARGKKNGPGQERVKTECKKCQKQQQEHRGEGGSNLNRNQEGKAEGPAVGEEDGWVEDGPAFLRDDIEFGDKVPSTSTSPCTCGSSIIAGFDTLTLTGSTDTASATASKSPKAKSKSKSNPKSALPSIATSNLTLFSTSGYGYAVIPSDDHPVTDACYPPIPCSTTCNHNVANTESQRLFRCMCDKNPQIGTETAAHSPWALLPQPTRFSYTTRHFRNREAMVRNGTVNDQDLCMTSWGYHRIARGQSKQQKERWRK